MANAINASFVVSAMTMVVSVVSAVGSKQMLKIRTERIGPILQRAMRPKLFSCAFFELLITAIPAPSAIIKGTVIGPVVTPPESKAAGIKLFGAKNARIMTAP